MTSHSGAPHTATRMFGVFAAVALVPVIALGLVLAGSYRAEADRRGLAEATRKSALIASTAVEPLLSGTDLRQGLSVQESSQLLNVARDAAARGTILRLRLRDLDGRVVFSPDGSGFGEAPEKDATLAAGGSVEADLTRLNADPNDVGSPGVPVVEVYRPLTSGAGGPQVGVLELYLHYQPISDDISSGLRTLYLDLAVGLAALYLVLAAIARVTTRRLQRYANDNAHLAEHDTLTGLPTPACSTAGSPS
jgi:diguanylate cyclase